MDRDAAVGHVGAVLTTWLLGAMASWVLLDPTQVEAGLIGVAAAVSYLVVQGVVVYRGRRTEEQV